MHDISSILTFCYTIISSILAYAEVKISQYRSHLSLRSLIHFLCSLEWRAQVVM